MGNKKWFSLAVIASVICVSSLSYAGFVSDPLFTIEATSSVGVGTFEVPLDAGVIDADTLTWQLQEPIVLIEDGDDSTVLTNAAVIYVADPIVTLNFVVSSGSATNYTVTSANLSFPSIANARGRSTAAVTVTDFNGNGASLTGQNSDNQAYEAFYNDLANVAATGSTFSTMIGGISSSTPFSSVTGSENFPVAPGFSTTSESGATLGTVSSMSSQFKFLTSAGDSASGTSTFVIIPEPAGMLLVIVGGCLLSMVRRRNS